MISEINGASLSTVSHGSTIAHGQSLKQAGENPPVEGQTPNVTELKAYQPEMVDESVSQLNKIVQTIQRDLQFSVDDDSGKTVVTVLDTHTKEVIRQIPTEQVLALSENIENLKGILFSAEV
ncbi:MAG: flagellar protein FlaG [Gammaproteobacteria bacterium]|nr:flagellar protein FlaG [Gammaproteobacteria bacterium]